MAESSFSFKRRNVLACGVAFAMAASMSFPAAAFADSEQAAAQPASVDAQPDAESPDAIAIDKGEVYQEAPSSASPIALFSYSYTRITPVDVSDNMKYFTLYESGRNYDQGFSYGDGYHALGYYQFDNRYCLQDFMQGCYWYDPDTFAMFKWATDSSVDLSSSAMAVNGQLTQLGQQAQDSWHAAYAANPKLFSQLQDGYAYTNYYVPAERYLRSIGIEISDRNDAVKGLAWGMCTLFGSGGMRYYFDHAGLANDMTDAQFVTNVCDSVIDHVADRVSNYASSYQNRYAREKATCLNIIDETGDTRAQKDAADTPADGGVAGGADSPSGEDQAGNNGSSSASEGESGTAEPAKPISPVQPGASDGESSASADSDAPATDFTGSMGDSAAGQPSAPADADVTPSMPGANEPSSSSDAATGDTAGSDASSGGTAGNASSGEQASNGISSPDANGGAHSGNSSSVSSEADGSESDKGSSSAENPAVPDEPKEPAVVTSTNPKGEDITTLSLNKTVAKEAGDKPQTRVGENSNSSQQVDANAVQRPQKLSQTNDGMMGLVIAMAAAAVAALAAIGVAVFRMTHRNR